MVTEWVSSLGWGEVTLELPSAHTQELFFSPWPEERWPSMCYFPGGDDPGVWLANQVKMLAARDLSFWVPESLELGPLPREIRKRGVGRVARVT